MKIYTKKGDAGKTSLVSGKGVSKSHPRLDAYGTLDELNSVVGRVASLTGDSKINDHLFKIQNQLFNIGSQLACDNKAMAEKLSTIKEPDIKDIELFIDEMTEKLTPLKNFILPGGTEAASCCHLARTVCRRAEREMIKLHEQDPIDLLHIQYINRLSDMLFTLARYINHLAKMPETTWKS